MNIVIIQALQKRSRTYTGAKEVCVHCTGSTVQQYVYLCTGALQELVYTVKVYRSYMSMSTGTSEVCVQELYKYIFRSYRSMCTGAIGV